MEITGILLTTCLSGAMGGFIGAIHKPAEHLLMLPFTKKRICLGAFGDGFVGALTALAFLPFAGAIVDDKIWATGHTAPETCKALFSMISVSILSGFLGLQMITKLASSIHDPEARKKVDDLKEVFDAQGWASEARLQLQEKRYEDALETLEKSIAITPSARAWGIKANVHYEMQDYTNALNAISQAIKLPEEDKKRKAFYFFNRACYRSLLDVGSEKEIQRIIDDAEEALKLYPSLKADLSTDDDLDNARKNEAFSKWLEQLK